MFRKFHHTSYPFDYRDVSRTIMATDVEVGDWLLVEMMDVHGNYIMTPLLTTKATLLVTITELRRSSKNGALSDGVS